MTFELRQTPRFNDWPFIKLSEEGKLVRVGRKKKCCNKQDDMQGKQNELEKEGPPCLGAYIMLVGNEAWAT